MNILGVVAHTMGYGDAGAALASGDRIVGFIEEERFTRKRYDDGFPRQAIRRLLDLGGLSGRHVDLVALHMSPYRGLANRAWWGLRALAGAPRCADDYLRYYFKYGNLEKELRGTLEHDGYRLRSFPHHECHAAATFFASSFDRAAFLTLDGGGEGLTGLLGTADRERGLRQLAAFSYPHSLGLFYSAVCDHLGFPPPAGPGKIMGLSAYGDPRRFADLFRRLAFLERGRPRLALEYFLFHRNLVTPITPKPWVAERFIRETGLPPRRPGDELRQEHMDLAAALQARLDELALEIARRLRDRTGEKYLCLGGGVALNSVMNGVIMESGVFDRVFVQPAAGDAGNALGAVYLAARRETGRTPVFACLPYAGPEYSTESIEAALREHPVTYRRVDEAARLAAEAVRRGEIIGWFQGRMEFGPRALGNRSILADPQRPEMKQVLNDRVKHREWFRPFAPAVTREAYARYFTGQEDNPYMLLVAHVKEEWRKALPAITHEDGTARVQSVARADNPRFHALLCHLGQLHRHPVVLNTSFNDRNQPIVESPQDALQCFLGTNLDRLFIGDFEVEKK